MLKQSCKSWHNLATILIFFVFLDNVAKYQLQILYILDILLNLEQYWINLANLDTILKQSYTMLYFLSILITMLYIWLNLDTILEQCCIFCNSSNIFVNVVYIAQSWQCCKCCISCSILTMLQMLYILLKAAQTWVKLDKSWGKLTYFTFQLFIFWPCLKHMLIVHIYYLESVNQSMTIQ